MATTRSGGAIFNQFGGATVAITDSTFTGNQASGRQRRGRRHGGRARAAPSPLASTRLLAVSPQHVRRQPGRRRQRRERRQSGGNGSGGAIHLADRPRLHDDRAPSRTARSPATRPSAGPPGDGGEGGCAFGGAIRNLGGYDDSPLILTVTTARFTDNRVARRRPAAPAPRAATPGAGPSRTRTAPSRSPTATVTDNVVIGGTGGGPRQRRGGRGRRPLQRGRLDDDRHQLHDRQQRGHGRPRAAPAATAAPATAAASTPTPPPSP